MDFYVKSDDVLRFSLLTMCYRALPPEAGSPSSFNPKCLDAARATLAKHEDCMSLVLENSDTYLATYFNW